MYTEAELNQLATDYLSATREYETDAAPLQAELYAQQVLALCSIARSLALWAEFHTGAAPQEATAPRKPTIPVEPEIKRDNALFRHSRDVDGVSDRD